MNITSLPITTSLNSIFVPSSKPVRRVIYDYNHADFPALRRALSEISSDITLTGSIDDCWMQWKDKFLSIVTSFVPIKTIQDTNSPPWIDG